MVFGARFPFTLSWQGLQCRVLPVQIGDYGLYHIYMQAESLSTSAHRELSFSPFLVRIIDFMLFYLPY